tara:strand:- start:83 stop:583 length:501 start_codon:yes stop_codon:yes gene_type:complete
MVKNLTLIILFFIISSCSSDSKFASSRIQEDKPVPGLFSKDGNEGISLNEILNPQINDNMGTNINGYLWRASLNVLSTAPLISTDALGGVIITDWYVDKDSKNQRLKITAFIKTSELKSNGIVVKVHIQNFKDGTWSETYTNKDLEIKIEDNILNEAINLRSNSKK